MSLAYNVNTSREDINIRSLRDKVDVESMKDTNATHVVVEIEWGARCIITCETNISKFSDDSKVDGALREEILSALTGGLLDGISGGGQADVGKIKNENDEKFTYFSKCDVSDLSQDLPITQGKAIEAAKKLSSVVKDTNEGKGIPMIFHLMPLTDVAIMCKLQFQINTVLQDIQQHIVKESVQFCEELQKRQRKLNDVHDVFKRNEDYISEEELTAIESLNCGFKVFKSRFREEMADTLVQIRSKKKDVSELQALITRYQDDDNFSESAVSKTLRQHDWINNKIATIEKCVTRGIKCIGRKDVLDVTGKAQHVYVLYFDEKIRTSRKDAWEKNFNFFLRLNKTFCQDDNFAFVIMDLQLRPEENKHKNISLPSIVHYQDCQPICTDVLVKEGKSRPLKQTNILILGETGVGKSTWINAIANYLCFDSLEEAEKNDFYTLIPSKFAVTDDKGESVDIFVGRKDDNEIFTPGAAATQYPKAHLIHYKDEVLCLIDTPGIGDTRGPKQDKTNFQNILTHLSNYEEIHGICILLKPNNARLTIMFRFCINELLTHLHKSAAANIVFCFTNSRGTMYKPGDTLPALRKNLGENKLVKIDLTPTTYYCFDNEAFRFLACLKNGQQYNENVKKIYSESWTKSVDETFRLFNHIEQLTPHPVRETSTLNDARRIIIEMNQPIAEVVKVIEKNIIKSKQFSDTIARRDKEVKLLEKELTFNGVDLDIKQLSRPTTTCTHNSCTKHVVIGNPKDNIRNTIYLRECHKPCGLSGVPNQIVGSSSLVKCWAFNGNGSRCRICGHEWQLHMHIRFETIEVPKTFPNEVANKERYEKLSDKEKIELKLKQQQVLIDELEEEKKRILKISNEFGHFLKTHSIVPYNDAVEEYLEMSIKAEEGKDHSIRDKDLIQKMKEDQKGYKEMNAIIEEAMRTNNPNFKAPTNDEIKQKRDELFRLKHFGETFTKALQSIHQINSSHFADQMGTPVFAPERPTQKKPRSNHFLQKVYNFVFTRTWK